MNACTGLGPNCNPTFIPSNNIILLSIIDHWFLSQPRSSSKPTLYPNHSLALFNLLSSILSSRISSVTLASKGQFIKTVRFKFSFLLLFLSLSLPLSRYSSSSVLLCQRPNFKIAKIHRADTQQRAPSSSKFVPNPLSIFTLRPLHRLIVHAQIRLQAKFALTCCSGRHWLKRYTYIENSNTDTPATSSGPLD